MSPAKSTKSVRNKSGAASNPSPLARTSKIWRATDLDTYDGPLLLDTHVWIWHLTGDATHLSPSVVSLLDRVGADQ